MFFIINLQGETIFYFIVPKVGLAVLLVFLKSFGPFVAAVSMSFIIFFTDWFVEVGSTFLNNYLFELFI